MSDLLRNELGVADYLEITDKTLSRTAFGVIDTSVSSRKRQGLLSGPELSQSVELNRKRVVEFISWTATRDGLEELDWYYVLISTAHLTSLGILAGSLLREWEYVPQYSLSHPIEPKMIDNALRDLARRVGKLMPAMRSHVRIDNLVWEFARIEWEIGFGPLHPFHDGCGRVSRYYSTLLSVAAGIPLVWKPSRAEYFEAAREGPEAFADYCFRQERLEVAPSASVEIGRR